MLTTPLSIPRRASTLICLSTIFISIVSLVHAQTETVLYNFTGEPDGAYPFAGLVRDGKGNLFGTTTSGGAFNHGAVFVVSKRGVEKVLYSFQGGSDGSYPNGSLLLDKAGDLYGTTSFGGGAAACTNGCGTIFQVTPSGTENFLYRFTGASDGSKPQSAPIRDAKGDLYGTASEGGDFFWGTAFRLSPAGVLTTLYAFTGNLDGGFLMDRWSAIQGKPLRYCSGNGRALCRNSFRGE